MWNPYCHLKKTAGLLKKLIDSYELMVNNDIDYSTQASSQGLVSIIDLALGSSKLGPLYIKKISEKY